MTRRTTRADIDAARQDFRDTLDDLRERAGLTKIELARRAWPGLRDPRSKLAVIERAGWIARPRAALELAGALGCKVSELFGGGS